MRSFFHFFTKQKNLKEKQNGWEFDFVENDFLGSRLDYDIIDSKSGKVYGKIGEKFNTLTSKNLKKDSVKKIFIDDETLIGKYLSKDIFNSKTWNNLF